MTRTPKIWVGVTVALMLSAGLALAATGRERSRAIYPPQTIPLKFSHQTHIEADVECVACHDPARKSEKASDLILPGHSNDSKYSKMTANERRDARHADCLDCHEIDPKQPDKKVKEGDPGASCDYCHPSYDFTVSKEPAKVSFPKPNIVFPHKVHIDKKIECKSCHGTMADVDFATEQQLPKMATCLECHDGHFAAEDCRTCHLTEASGRLQQTFASGILRPLQGNPFGMDHGPRYEFNHGNRAAIARQSCMQCHSESYCQTCHDSMQKPLSIHPNDFITLHPLQARVNATQCDSCHRYQSFCAACHDRAGVGQTADPKFRPENTRVHPDYVVWVEQLGPQHHGIASARNPQQCMACHREESCLSCHAEFGKISGGLRSVNPHPTTFKQSCKGYFAKNPTACMKCHLPGIEERCD